MASQPTRKQAPGNDAAGMETTTKTQGWRSANRSAGADASRPPVTPAAAIQVAGLRKKFGHVAAVEHADNDEFPVSRPSVEACKITMRGAGYVRS